jgi:hypothetical protein
MIFVGFLLATGLVVAGYAHPAQFFFTLILWLAVAVICLIRRSNALFTGVFVITAFCFLGAIALATSRGPGNGGSLGWFGLFPLFLIGWMLAFLLVVAEVKLFARIVCGIWRTIDKEVVGCFAFVYALFAARVFHYFLPAHLPKAINDHVWFIFRDPGSRSTRSAWTWLFFYLCYKLINFCLIRVLGLNSAPPSSPPHDPDRPDSPLHTFLHRSRPFQLWPPPF